MPAKDYASTRFSELAEITPANATRLRPVWTFSTGVLAGHQGQPLVVKNTMYVVTPWPNVLYAFDLTQEGYPLKWKYRPDVSPNAIGIACCDVINRGAFYADGKIVYNLLDGHTVAVDAASGKELWKTQFARRLGEGETTPMAPFVVKDRVIVGASGGEFGIYGWVKGLDLKTGKVVWTGRNIGPDADMLVKPGTFKPFYDKGTELGAKSWPDGRLQDRRRAGLGLDVVRPRARPGLLRRGQPVALQRRAAAGRQQVDRQRPRAPARATARWSGPTSSPRTTTGTTTPSPTMILADVKIGGQTRKALVTFNKNGFQYTLDRATGEVLAAQPYVARELGQEHRSQDRPPGARLHQAHRRVQGRT